MVKIERILPIKIERLEESIDLAVKIERIFSG